MLLSLYASFRWARRRNYVLEMMVFVVVASLLSAVLAVSMLSAFYGPVGVLSFPFYGFWGERRMSLSPPYKFSQWIVVYDIYFLDSPISALEPQGRVVSDVGGGEGYVDVVSYRVTFLGVEIGSVSASVVSIFYFSSSYPLVLPLWFFMLVNTVGGLLGFLIRRFADRVPVFQRREWRAIDSHVTLILGLLFFMVGLSFLGVGLLPFGGIVVIYSFVWFGVFLIELVWRSRGSIFLPRGFPSSSNVST